MSCEMVLFKLKVILGPYISCQFLSLSMKFFINGVIIELSEIVDVLINHKLMAENPFFKKNREENDNVIPINIPNENIMRIDNFIWEGKINNCSGEDNHNNIFPLKIDAGIISIMGVMI